MPYIIDGIYECVQHMPRGSELREPVIYVLAEFVS